MTIFIWKKSHKILIKKDILQKKNIRSIFIIAYLSNFNILY